MQWVSKAKKADVSQDVIRRFVAYKPAEKTYVFDESESSGPGMQQAEVLSSMVASSDDALTRWCRRILHHGFETVFGLSFGRYGCPFVIDATCEASLHAVQLFEDLDKYMDNNLDRQDPYQTFMTAEPTSQRHDQVDRSLWCAIRAFTANWLPLVLQKYYLSTAEVRDIITDSWRAARKDMLRVINRTSYRSVLALYLFAQTPIPVGITEDEELDGLSGPLCMQTALYQLQKLRERRSACQKNDAILDSSADSADITSRYMDLESRAYWAAVMWDTSSSLTLGFRTSLTSGLQGACSEPTWRLVKAFLVGSFKSRTDHWHNEGFEVTNEVASEIISAACICKTYIWQNVTSLKEGLREGVHDDGMLVAWIALLDANDIFNSSIRPLLRNCERRLHFLDQSVRLNWYVINLQYFLGILILVNALEATVRDDLLAQISSARQDGEHESFNILKFVLENTYTIYGPEWDNVTVLEANGDTNAARPFFSASFVAADPYPQYVVDLVLLLHKSLHRIFRGNDITRDTHSHLLSILCDALQQLPQSSKSVRDAQESLQRSTHEVAA